MKAFTKIFGGLLIFLAIAFVFAIFLPSKQTITSSIIIDDSPERIFNEINDLRNWENWNPFFESDSNLVISIEGKKSGAGAILQWDNQNGDKGVLKIIESNRNISINNHLDLHNSKQVYGYWNLKALNGKTELSWKLELVDLSYPVEKTMGIFIRKKIQEKMDNGLQNIKKHLNKIAINNPYNIIETNYKHEIAIVIKDSCHWDEIGERMGEMYSTLIPFIKEQNISIKKFYYTHYLVWDEDKQFTVFELGIPINSRDSIIENDFISTKESPGGRVIKAIHWGDLDQTYQLYTAMDKYMKDNNLIQTGGPWEVYINAPTTIKNKTKWLTEIYFPIADN